MQESLFFKVIHSKMRYSNVPCQRKKNEPPICGDLQLFGAHILLGMIVGTVVGCMVGAITLNPGLALATGLMSGTAATTISTVIFGLFSRPKKMPQFEPFKVSTEQVLNNAMP
ncbi:MAG: hypothetical protein K2Q14_06275 [Gammaproteobacteria bacterium]|nr:hypothetical protein [Gammaproteobacteria bacterium]